MKTTGALLRMIIVVLILMIKGEVIKAQIKIDGYAINPKLGAYKTEYTAFIIGGEFNVTSKRTIYSVDYYRTFQIMNPERLKMIDFMVVDIMVEEYFDYSVREDWVLFPGKK